jgi:lysozyme
VATDTLLALIKHHEGWHAVAYQDPVGKWTIGWGRTEGVYESEQTTPEHEHRWLNNTLAYIAESIMELIDVKVAVKMTQNQLDALTSLAFNVGMGAPGVKKGFYESRMRAKLNAGDFPGAASEFDDWIYAGGKVLLGLVRRRDAEKQLFLR